MTDEEFRTVYRALCMANNGYTVDDIPTLVALEGKAWTVLQQIKARAALTQEAPSGLPAGAD